MFEINIFDLLATLCIGTFSLVSILYISFICLQFFNIRRNNTEVFLSYLTDLLKKEFKQTGYAIIALIVVFTLGILTQDFTDHLSDSENSKNPFAASLKRLNLLDTEGELRVGTLINNDTSLTGLGNEIFNTKSIACDSIQKVKGQTYFCNCNEASSYWASNGSKIYNSKDSLKKFTSYVNGIYYTAKNWCFLKSDPIRDELSEIQTRIDLSRSLSIVSFMTILIVLLSYVAYRVKEKYRGRHKFKILVVSSINQKKKTRVLIKRFHPFQAIGALLLIFFVSRLCYSVAENNFNERAFGYYVSHFKYSDNESKK